MSNKIHLKPEEIQRSFENNINKEAEEYADFKHDYVPMTFSNTKFNEGVKNGFIAGHNSKATQYKVLQAQIDILKETVKSCGHYLNILSLEIIDKKIKKFQEQLKEYE